MGSQADPPTFKHDGFTIGILTFSTKRRSRSEAGFGSVLGLPRGSFGNSGACFWDSLGPLARPKRVSRFILDLYGALFARFLLLNMVSGPFPLLSEPHGVDFEPPADLPTFKNDCCTIGMSTFPENKMKQRVRSDDGLGSVLGLSRGPFGSSGACLEGLSRASKSTQESFQIHLGILLGLACSPLDAKDGLGTVISSFGTSRGGF